MTRRLEPRDRDLRAVRVPRGRGERDQIVQVLLHHDLLRRGVVDEEGVALVPLGDERQLPFLRDVDPALERMEGLELGRALSVHDRAHVALAPAPVGAVDVGVAAPRRDEEVPASAEERRVRARDRFQVHALRRGALSSSYLIDPLAALEDAGATILWQERTMIDAALVDALHAAGMVLFAWTVDDPAEMRRLLELGVDAICSNVPDAGRQAVDSLVQRFRDLLSNGS